MLHRHHRGRGAGRIPAARRRLEQHLRLLPQRSYETRRQGSRFDPEILVAAGLPEWIGPRHGNDNHQSCGCYGSLRS